MSRPNSRPKKRSQVNCAGKILFFNFNKNNKGAFYKFPVQNDFKTNGNDNELFRKYRIIFVSTWQSLGHNARIAPSFPPTIFQISSLNFLKGNL